jgi:hypothetical protein
MLLLKVAQRTLARVVAHVRPSNGMSTENFGARTYACVAISCALVGCTTDPTTCRLDWPKLEPLQAGEHSVAFRVHGEAVDADEYHAAFEGSLANQSTQAACAFAIYQFDAPPDREQIAPVVVGETPPDTIAGGGRLLDYGVLPARTEQIFEVPFDRIGLGDDYFVPEIDTTIVVASCSEPTVDIDIEVELFTCAYGQDVPPQQPDLMEQLW